MSSFTRPISFGEIPAPWAAEVAAGIAGLPAVPDRLPAAQPAFSLVSSADVWIEAFGCELPRAFVQRMAAALRAPVWINLEYLTAESWIELVPQDDEAVLEEEPREPILLNYLGVLLYELGESRTAELLFQAAVRLDDGKTFLVPLAE